MLSKPKLYTISLIEGAAVMAAEIGGAKLLAPFFGSSLYVWSSVMAITLGGLASGYFVGGQWSKRENKTRILRQVLIAAVVCLCVMPFLAHLFGIIAMHLPLILAVMVSVFVLLFPTTLCMGATSPLIISLLTDTPNQSGENSGKVYAISTLGGITATFLCGFYLIPTIGIKLTLLCFAFLLAVGSLLLTNKKSHYFFVLCPAFIAFCSVMYFPLSKQVRYTTEGILGKLEIKEEMASMNTSVVIRKLLINNIIQTEMNMDTKQSVSDYVRLIEENMGHFPKGKALVLGLGGGLIANMLTSWHYSVTAVEFDERIIEAARQFFHVNDSVKIIHDDARHYMNTCQEKYQLILFDMFKAEEQPSHVITIESLNKLKQIMNKESMILVNTHGYLTGTNGLGTQCLLATLKKAGFYIKLCTYSKDEDYRNLLLFATTQPLEVNLKHELPSVAVPQVIEINTDDKPVLEVLNAPANQAWRNSYLNNYILRHDQH